MSGLAVPGIDQRPHTSRRRSFDVAQTLSGWVGGWGVPQGGGASSCNKDYVRPFFPGVSFFVEFLCVGSSGNFPCK